MTQNMEYFHVYVSFLFNAKDEDWTNSTRVIFHVRAGVLLVGSAEID